MLSEKDMEDAICGNPEKYLGEPGLKLIARQYRVGNYIFDLLFEDRHGAKLIVEIQKGTLDRNHTYKILDYSDEYKENNPNSFIELMIIANKIPYERRKRLDSKGISWKEISESDFQEQFNDDKDKGFVARIPTTLIIDKNNLPSIQDKPPPAKATPNAMAPVQGTKSQYMLDLLQQAGKDGLTWEAIREALIAKFGNAPKKRRSLYLLLEGRPWHKKTGANGVVTYFLDTRHN
jgi:hypothetical protein